MRGLHALGRERPSDIGEAPALHVRKLDAIHKGAWNRPRASGGPPLHHHRSGRPDVLPHEPFELLDGNETLTPHGVFTVSTAGTTLRSIVETLTPSASAACLRE